MCGIINIRFVYGRADPRCRLEDERETTMSAAAECGKRKQTGHGRAGAYLFEVIEFVQRAGAVARQRRALMRLGDSALKDFGASRADAWNEAGRSWWDLPKDR
jgi:uncharacterized protein YjiS (DUF1127 family)